MVPKLLIVLTDSPSHTSMVQIPFLRVCFKLSQFKSWLTTDIPDPWEIWMLLQVLCLSLWGLPQHLHQLSSYSVHLLKVSLCLCRTRGLRPSTVLTQMPQILQTLSFVVTSTGASSLTQHEVQSAMHSNTSGTPECILFAWEHGYTAPSYLQLTSAFILRLHRVR